MDANESPKTIPDILAEKKVKPGVYISVVPIKHDLHRMKTVNYVCMSCGERISFVTGFDSTVPNVAVCPECYGLMPMTMEPADES